MLHLVHLPLLASSRANWPAATLYMCVTNNYHHFLLFQLNDQEKQLKFSPLYFYSISMVKPFEIN